MKLTPAEADALEFIGSRCGRRIDRRTMSNLKAKGLVTPNGQSLTEAGWQELTIGIELIECGGFKMTLWTVTVDHETEVRIFPTVVGRMTPKNLLKHRYFYVRGNRLACCFLPPYFLEGEIALRYVAAMNKLVGYIEPETVR